MEIKGILKHVKVYDDVAGKLLKKLDENGATRDAMLGRAFFAGVGMPKDEKKAFEYTKKAFEKGEPESALAMAVIHGQKEEYFDKMAEKGNLAAREFVALLKCEDAYVRSGKANGCVRISKTTLQWLMECADADYVQSLMLLGQMYEPTNPWQRPCILPQGYYASIGNAYNYFKRAADLGVEDAIEKVNEIEKGRCPYCGSLYTSVRTQKSVFRRSDSLERFCKDCKESFDY